MTHRKLVHLLCVLIFTCSALCRVVHAQPIASGRDCSAYPYAPPFPPAPATYVHRYNGIDQNFLDMESGVGPVTASEYAILDALLDEAKQRLRPVPTGLAAQDYDAFAIDSLKTMDCIHSPAWVRLPGSGPGAASQ